MVRIVGDLLGYIWLGQTISKKAYCMCLAVAFTQLKAMPMSHPPLKPPEDRSGLELLDLTRAVKGHLANKRQRAPESHVQLRRIAASRHLVGALAAIARWRV